MSMLRQDNGEERVFPHIAADVISFRWMGRWEDEGIITAADSRTLRLKFQGMKNTTLLEIYHKMTFQ